MQRMPQNLSRLRKSRAIVRSTNAFSVDIMVPTWERKFVYFSVDIWFAMPLETKGISLHYTKV